MRGMNCFSRRLFCGTPCYKSWNRRPEQVQARFWVKVKKSDGCWIWQGARSSVTHYGMFNYLGHNIHAHRAAWIITNGPIAHTRIHVLHSCYNGHLGCVRPSHLYLGDYKQNGRDTVISGRSTWGARSTRAKLTEEQAHTILELQGKARSKDLAAKYGVGHGAISAIWRGDSWRQLKGRA